MGINDFYSNTMNQIEKVLEHYWTIWTLLAFFAIAKIVYFLIQTTNDSRSYEVRMSEMLDIFIFGFVLLYLIIYFSTSTAQSIQQNISNILDRTHDYLDNPFSWVHLALFLLGFYTIIYFLRIPMNDNKSMSVWLIENTVTILFVILFIIEFFKLFFQINLVNLIISDGLIRQWKATVPKIATTQNPTIETLDNINPTPTRNSGGEPNKIVVLNNTSPPINLQFSEPTNNKFIFSDTIFNKSMGTPSGTTRAPLGITGAPLGITGAPLGITGAPLGTTQVPLEIIGAPTTKSAQPTISASEQEEEQEEEEEQ